MWLLALCVQKAAEFNQWSRARSTDFAVLPVVLLQMANNYQKHGKFAVLPRPILNVKNFDTID